MRSTRALGLFVLLFALAPGCQTSSWLAPSTGPATVAEARPDRKMTATRFADGESSWEHFVGDMLIFAVDHGLPLAQVRALFGEPRPSRNSPSTELVCETFQSGMECDHPVTWDYHQYGVRLEFRSSLLWSLLSSPSSITYERVTGAMEP
jgi:hypothetical protein